MMPVFDKNTGARVMKKLASLGVPLAESGKFLGYIM